MGAIKLMKACGTGEWCMPCYPFCEVQHPRNETENSKMPPRPEFCDTSLPVWTPILMLCGLGSGPELNCMGV